MMTHRFTLGLASLTLFATACGGAGLPELESDEAPVSGTITSRSLVVTDPAILARFPLSRTLDAIRASGQRQLGPHATVDRTWNNTTMFQAWFRDNFGTSACLHPNVNSFGFGMVCPRPEERLATQDPFAPNAPVTFEPIGLFNRFDLMPSDGRTCGEYRIVYAMRRRGPSTIGGRGFMIFEGVLPNPDSATGVEGCVGVARFWQALSADASVTSRADKLERFYYTGGTVRGFGPVVDASNYGGLFGGQVRTNMFVDSREWNLGEFVVRGFGTPVGTSQNVRIQFVRTFVADNPAEELFAGTRPSHVATAAFPTLFAAPDLNSIAMSTSYIPTRGLNMNEFESSASSGAVIYRNFANANMRATIQAELTRLRSPLTVDNILDRASTQTCGGCHALAAGRQLGGGLRWPSALFVHIDESGNLSPALTQVFLPHRLATLEAFINARETASGPLSSTAGEAITGRPAGSAN
jgi:hypothetical protein